MSVCLPVCLSVLCVMLHGVLCVCCSARCYMRCYLCVCVCSCSCSSCCSCSSSSSCLNVRLGPSQDQSSGGLGGVSGPCWVGAWSISECYYDHFNGPGALDVQCRCGAGVCGAGVVPAWCRRG